MRVGVVTDDGDTISSHFAQAESCSIERRETRPKVCTLTRGASADCRGLGAQARP